MNFFKVFSNFLNNSSTFRIFPGACIIKIITAVINSVTYQASVFVSSQKKVTKITMVLAYCTRKLITYIKSFMIQAPGVPYIVVM
jgi:hypothetical protein